MFDMSGLNPEQQAAVNHDDRPLLVLAGAGTGKTSTLAARVAALLERGVPPERVCLLTFSRRASTEMLARAGRMADPALAARVVGGTFHAVATQLLRRYGSLIGLDPGFSVLDSADTTELIGLVRHDLGLSGTVGPRFPRKETLASILSHVANAQVKLSDVLAHSFPWCAEDIEGIRAVFSAYTVRKRAQQLCDFDDLLLLVRAIGTSDVGRKSLESLFDHVLVDEYQDVNRIQVDLVDLLRPGGTGLSVVGDDAQAIYGFRAATTAAIAEFPDRYASAVVIRLEHNYRSTPPILAVANQVMADAPEGASKTLWSERPGRRRPVLRTCTDESAQAEAVCESVLSHREAGVALNQQVVLFRAAHHSDLLELALGRRRIPYVKYGGLRFVEAAHVKDFLAILRLLDNPWDELAWFRILQLLEGVGAATARRVMDQLGVRRSGDGAGAADAALSPVAQLLAAAPTVPAPARDELNGLRRTLGDCVVEPAPPVGTQADTVTRWLAPIVQRRYDAPAARCGDLERLSEQAAAAPTRDRFVADLTLDPPVIAGDMAGRPVLDDDWLVLSTVHSAKGGEWDVVHVIHAADGAFPSDMATGDLNGIAEERRLFYVAVTRARDALEISAPLRYHHHRNRLDDRHGYAPLPRFLSGPVRSLMDTEQAGGRYTFPEAVDVPEGSGVGAVDALLADLWS
ncbi:MAG TPA: ATP-dependent helicase [Acidimicrobiales bacterium]|nr:ATP-dependent helicase [Acidimicrobiales bacterium]